MTNPNDGGPAFPQLNPNSAVEVEMAGKNSWGMSLRDWFAGQAMQGLISCDAFHGPLYQQQCSEAARFAYEVADAMLLARSEGGAK